MAEEKQDGQKTLVAFVVGLLIGGMLVWAFSGPSADAPEMSSDDTMEESADENMDSDDNSDDMSDSASDSEGTETTTPAPQLEIGDGEVVVTDQEAGMSVALESAVYPVSEGWIGVRDYTNEQLGLIKGVARFSESDGLVPSDIFLQAPTVAGMTYAIVIFTEDGDKDFSLAGDVQIDTIYDTFTAQ